MSTTVVRPHDPELGRAVRCGLLFGLLTLLFHALANLYQAHLGYGYFRDEMYYLICGRRLAWGYVDHGPLVAVQARVAETVFGRSLLGLRMLSALGGAGRVFFTSLLTWALGGRRPAQVLAMMCVSLAPVYLGIDSVLSMNSWESLFWMPCLLALILMVRGGSPKLWLLFGAAAGLGLLNKPSMTFFLVALLAALLISPQRKLLFSPWSLGGVLLLLLIVSPFLTWEIHHQWPTLEFLNNGRLHHKNKALAPIPFLITQILDLNPASFVLWAAGLLFLLRRETWRWLGLTFAFFLAGMMALHAKDYYVMPIYPLLFAAGGVARQERSAKKHRTAPLGWWSQPTFQSVLLLSALILLPMSTPILRPAAWITYARTLHLRGASGNSENESSGPLPQFYADRFGWQEEVDTVERVAASLTPEERKHLLILCDNYGEASALNFLGHGLPWAASGQNNYFLWGLGDADGETAILIEDTTPEHLRQFYDRVDIVGHMGTTYSMPFEHRDIFLLHGRKIDLQKLWPNKKAYI